MDYLKNLTAAAAILFLVGCAAPDPPPPPKTVFDPLTQQLERARDVQKTVDEHAEKSRQTIDTQERGDTSQ